MRDEQLRDAAIANKWSTTLSTTILEYAAIALPSAQSGLPHGMEISREDCGTNNEHVQSLDEGCGARQFGRPAVCDNTSSRFWVASTSTDGNSTGGTTRRRRAAAGIGTGLSRSHQRACQTTPFFEVQYNEPSFLNS